MESLGQYLKTERVARGVTLEEVSRDTRVPLETLRSIEDDRLDDLPGDVFVRGFLRAYARSVGLDPTEVVARLDRPAPQPTLPRILASERDLRRRRIASPALVLVVLLAALAFAFMLWRPAASPFSAQGSMPTAGTAG